MNRKRLSLSNIIAILLAVAAVIYVVPPLRHGVEGIFGEKEQRAEDTSVYFTCPMHPDIRLNQLGDCPICGMSLVEKVAGEGEGERSNIHVTPTQVQLTGVRTEPVRARSLAKEIDTYGKIDYDERRLAYVAAWIDGRIDTLFVDFTGVEVQKGHALVSLYSPKLVSGQQEYLLAVDGMKRAEASGSDVVISKAEDVLEASRRRLLNWGLTERQLANLATSREVKDHVTIFAPIGGTVIHKNAFEGMYVKEGDRLFQIADLSTVWMYAEVYEDDIPFLYEERPGDYYECPMHPRRTSPKAADCPDCRMPMIRTNPNIKIDITTRALPGEVFQGTISFADPFLNPKTRTLRVRVNIDNRERHLLPEMFARARINLDAGEALAVPENAVIHSGKRSLVLVDEGQGRFRPQPIRLGRLWLQDPERMTQEGQDLVFSGEAMRYHEVLMGLEGGERVVTSGNFLLGSESKLQGALAKMVEETEAEWSRRDSLLAALGSKREILGQAEPGIAKILDAYYSIRSTLAADSQDGVAKEADAIVEAAKNSGLADPARRLAQSARRSDIGQTRETLKPLSENLIAYLQLHGSSGEHVAVAYYCPMAGASWIQDSKDMGNPYYGSSMLKCGSEIPLLSVEAADGETTGHTH
jgi:Cu(I)/Ag(I) efflux system membrane fusion protein